MIADVSAGLFSFWEEGRGCQTQLRKKTFPPLLHPPFGLRFFFWDNTKNLGIVNVKKTKQNKTQISIYLEINFFFKLTCWIKFQKNRSKKKKCLGNATGETSSGTTERMTNQIKSFVSLSYVSSSVFFFALPYPSCIFWRSSSLVALPPSSPNWARGRLEKDFYFSRLLRKTPAGGHGPNLGMWRKGTQKYCLHKNLFFHQ